MFNITNRFSDMFAGNSKSHFTSAAAHVEQAGVDGAQAATNVAYAGVNAAAVGAQVAAGFTLYKYIAGEIIGLNSLMQGAAYTASYFAPEKLITGAINLGAKITGFMASSFATNPLTTLTAVELVTIMLSPEYVINTVKYGAQGVYETAKVGVDLTCAAGEVAIGTALLAYETGTELYNYTYDIKEPILDMAGITDLTDWTFV